MMLSGKTNTNVVNLITPLILPLTLTLSQRGEGGGEGGALRLIPILFFASKSHHAIL
jgi:hypothetical protein